MKYVYSTNGGKTFKKKVYSNRKEAARAARCETTGGNIYTGALLQYYPRIDGSLTVRLLQKDAKKKYGYLADDWLKGLDSGQTLSLGLALGKALRRWLKKENKEPDFYKVIGIKKEK